MSIQTLSDKSLEMQLKVINAVNDAKRFVVDSFTRREEGMEMVQAAILVVVALVASYALYRLFQTVGNKFDAAGRRLNEMN